MRGHLPGYVVCRGTQTAGDKKNFAAREQFGQRLPNCVGIGNRAALFDAQTEREDLARDEWEMRVLNVAEQKFRAGVEKNDAHVEKVEALRRLIVEPVQLF